MINTFKKLFNRGAAVAKEVQLVSPLSGSILPLNELADPAFQLLGEGIAILPVTGEVVSPAAGEVLFISPTKHAIGICTEEGVEVLIHVGIDTVNMDGEGFVSHVKKGDKVIRGQKLLTFSLELVEKKAKSILTPVIITNPLNFSSVVLARKEYVQLGETILFTLV